MTFATEIDKGRSYRHTLVRLTPARYVGGDLVSEGSGIYGMTFPYPIARIERNGTALTEDAAAPTVDDHWFHDEVTGALDVKLATAPNAFTNVVVVYYYLFYATHAVSAHETPTDSATAVRPWQPRIVSDPSFSQSLSDVFYGIFTIQASQVQIRNDDFEFQSFLSANDSFLNKAVDAWIVVNDQVQRVFVGVVTQLALGDGVATLQVHDVFEKLNESAFMGDDYDECYLMTSTGAYASMDPRFNFTPVRYVIGRSKHAFRSLSGTAYCFWGRGYVLDQEMSEQAILTAAPQTASTTTNRGPWMLGRTGPGGLKTVTLPSVTVANLFRSDLGTSRYTYGDGSFRPQLLLRFNGHPGFEVGDSISFTHASLNAGATQYAVCTEVAFGTPSSSAYYFIVLSRTNTIVADMNLAAGITISTTVAPAVVLVNNSYSTGPLVAVLAYGLDYTLTETTLTSGNKSYELDLVDAFETATNHDGAVYHPNIGSPDLTTHSMAFRLSSSQASNVTRHDQVLQTMLAAAGLTCDTASFAAAGAALAATASFTIPSANETEIGPYFDYVQRLLGSTLGIVSLNATDGEVEYELAAAPSSSTDITSNHVMASAPSVEIDYRDIVTEIGFVNPHLPDVFPFFYAIGTVSSSKARYLHGTKKKLSLSHVLDFDYLLTIGLGVNYFADVLAIRSARRAVYRFSLATQLLDAAIGDDVQLTHVAVLGGGGTDDLKILTLNKSADVVDVEATDLEGI